MSAPSGSAAVDLSIIVVSHNEGEWLLQTVAGLLAASSARSEIIVVDDASTDGSARVCGARYPGVRVLRSEQRLGVAGARNVGSRAAAGTILVFTDAHVTAPTGWWAPLRAALELPQVGAVGPGIAVMGQPSAVGYGLAWQDAALNVAWLPLRQPTPYAVPLLSGCFLVVRRDAFDRLGGFDAGLRLRGSTDTEFCLRLWTAGYECWLVPAVTVAHLFRTDYPYTVEQAAILHNLLRVGVVHFSEERLRRLTAALSAALEFPAACALLLDGDAWERRAAVQAARRHDAEWFFSRFPGAQ